METWDISHVGVVLRLEWGHELRTHGRVVLLAPIIIKHVHNDFVKLTKTHFKKAEIISVKLRW